MQNYQPFVYPSKRSKSLRLDTNIFKSLKSQEKLLRHKRHQNTTHQTNSLHSQELQLVARGEAARITDEASVAWCLGRLGAYDAYVF